MDERVAQYSNLYSWLFWPTVQQKLGTLTYTDRSGRGVGTVHFIGGVDAVVDAVAAIRSLDADAILDALELIRICSEKRKSRGPLFTMVQHRKIHSNNSHQINFLRARQFVSKQSTQAKRAVRSKQMRERCEQTSEWMSKRPGTYVWIINFSEPQCFHEDGTFSM